MGNNKDLYATLGLSKGASPEEVRTAYRKLARELHPDRNPGDTKAEERFKDVSHAYDVLGDTEKRRLYDEFGAEGLQSGFDPQRAREYRRWADSGHGFSFGGDAFGFDLGGRGRRRQTAEGRGFADLFGEMFGGGRPQQAPKPKNLEYPIEVDFLDALRGTTMQVSVRRPIACDQCGGSGQRGSRACGRCMGTGSREQTERLSVKIPPGVGNGSRVRVTGKGGQARPGAPTGHLDFIVSLRPHPFLEREGKDLLMDLPVTVREAVAGATVTVPTPSGKVQLKVKPGSQSGQRLRLAGRGAPDPKGGPAGDLIVRLLVRVPEPGTDGLHEALEALEAAYGGDVRADLTLEP